MITAIDSSALIAVSLGEDGFRCVDGLAGAVASGRKLS